MGAKFTNVQVRTEDPRAVAEALEPILGDDRAYLGDPSRGWVGVYPEKTHAMDEEELQRIARSLSDTCRAPAIAFMFFETFWYWLYESGRLEDHYCFQPDMFDDHVAPSIVLRSAGSPEKLLAIAPPGTEIASLAGLLRRPDRPTEQDLGEIGLSAGRLRELMEMMQRARTLGPEAIREAREEGRRQAEELRHGSCAW